MDEGEPGGRVAGFGARFFCVVGVLAASDMAGCAPDQAPLGLPRPRGLRPVIANPKQLGPCWMQMSTDRTGGPVIGGPTAPFTQDAICIGGGYAGLVAANRAAQLGARVLVLERGEDVLYPCNSRYAGGVMHVSYENPKATAKALTAAIARQSEGFADPRLVDAVVRNAGRTIDWLRAEGALFAKGGSAGWKQWLLAPLRPPVTHMEWRGRGADVTLRLLERNLQKRGGSLLRGVRAVRLLTQDGVCSGVVAQQNGAEVTFLARNVVLADGGFQGNESALREHVTPSPSGVKQRSAGTGLGDGLRMAREAGAGITSLDAFYGHVLSRDALHSDRLWPYPQLDELAAAGVVVDRTGGRFADEGLGGVFLANAIARQPDPLAAVIVFDARIWKTAGCAAAIPPNPTLVTAGGTLLAAESIEALALAAGLDAEVLAATISDYNGALREQGGCAHLSPERSMHRGDHLYDGRHPD